ncbi:predicted protein [Streptomyces viridosporus ATCC 14672]|uniref:Predicted protein n=1 Tax=Streptomyces viridosporus (strain ATCC 14672 / DSM 40746 / JCM 4963 / KCTC 9882 / NRRL B-12104 / FH 1290) TaxID=566461 RepID=D5ZUA1_STRV1|nr:predicted protein [Streptomyces viridosporus ATCC 14672]
MIASAGSTDPSLGTRSTVSLPSHAQGNPPPWSDKAFRQGVVAKTDPYAAEVRSSPRRPASEGVRCAGLVTGDWRQ